MENIVLSVVIPCFNVEASINRTLRSIFKSPGYLKVKDFIEIIVIDDASEDNTFRIIEKSTYYDELSLIRHKKNLGLQAARSTGIQEAKGEFILSVDSDDELIFESLLAVWGELLNNKFDIIVFNYLRQNAEGYFYRFFDNVDPSYCHFKGPVWNKIVRRNLIVKSSYITAKSVNSTEDLLFCASIWQPSLRILYSQDCLVKYYNTVNGIQGSMNNVRYILNQVEVGRRLLDILATKDLPRCIIEHYLAHIYIRRLAAVLRMSKATESEIDVILSEVYEQCGIRVSITYKARVILRVFSLRELYFKLLK